MRPGPGDSRHGRCVSAPGRSGATTVVSRIETAMLKVIFTLDYEIHGNGDGCPYALMVEPTNRMMRQFESYGAKLTIMADVAEILKFKEYREQVGRDDFHYDAIAEQLRDAIRRGHDVQLHLHSSYFNARHEGGRWRQDWSEYNFAGLAPERLKAVVAAGKAFLETLLQSVDSKYRCYAFRAANWSVSPSPAVVRALIHHGIKVETSVFKHGHREGLVNFDYRAAYSEMVPWKVAEADICAKDDSSSLVEFPIYCENRWLGAFVTPQRIYRALVGRLHRFRDETGLPAGVPGGAKRNGGRRHSILLRRHAWKADFNQCNGRQLTRALARAQQRYGPVKEDLPFVLIGHSKLFTRFNEWSLRPFLAHVRKHPRRFGFARFSDFDLR